MDKKVIDLSEMLFERAKVQAECFPVDRYFLQQYLDQILSINRNEFLFYNLERDRNTYTVQLFLCLPELWEDISIDEILDFTKRFTNIFSFYTLIEITHRFIEINIIELLIHCTDISKHVRKNIVSYIKSSFFPNLIKSEGDFLFFREGLYGVDVDAFVYTKQRLLLDKRVKPAVTSINEMTEYVKLLSV
jgi:hypothetical protein